MPEQKSNDHTSYTYTGKTIAMPRYEDQRQPPPPPSPRRRYENPPPSQRAGRNQARAQPPARQPQPPARQPQPPARQPQPQPAPPAWRQRMLRRVWRVLLVLLLATLAGAVLLYVQANAVAGAVVMPDVRGNASLATPLMGGANVLLVGVDERPDHPDEGVRSDTLILAHLNGAGQWVSLLSIPRDTQVDIPNVGLSKINVAYGEGYARAEELYGPGTTPQQGGMALAAQAVEKFLNLGAHGTRIDYVAQVNFDGFIGVIDALGGITVDVPAYIFDDAYPTEDFGYMQVEFQPGPQRMDGQTALIYARTRHADSDFARSARQQQVLHALVNELQGRAWAGRVAAMPALLGSLTGDEAAEQAAPVLTTMPIDRPDILLGLALLAGGLDSDAIKQVRINPDTVLLLQEIGSDLVWEPSSVGEQVREWQRPPEPAPAQGNGPEVAPELAQP